MKYSEMSQSALHDELNKLKEEFSAIKAKGLKLDMSRGKPEKRQLDLSLEMMTNLKTPEDFISEKGYDVRNYGFPTGVEESKRLFAEIFGLKETEILATGNSSLNFLYNVLADAMLFGFPESKMPWSKCDCVKFLCPVPGYDRHFTIAEHLGIKMINVPMTESGPDMDIVEKSVSEDESIKGIFCVPKYQNPTGVTFSNEIVKRFAKLKPKAKDFKIFWDNAYYLHDLYEDKDELLNIHREAEKYGNEDMILEFFSTSKITLAGSGISFFASSEKNIELITARLKKEGMGYDKVNQLRHFKYLKNKDNVYLIMKKQAEILRPKFDAVISVLESELSETGTANWYAPKGGYFISLNVLPGTAKRTWSLANELGVTLTNVGGTFPYGIDPDDTNLRLAPSNAKTEDIKNIIKYVCICAKIAALEKILKISC